MAAVEDIFRQRSVFGESGERDDRNLCAVRLHAQLPERQEVVHALRPKNRCFHARGGLVALYIGVCRQRASLMVLSELEVDSFES